MMQAAAKLSELERDALTELVNIGVSRAAGSLRKMVGREVLLSVPAIEIVGQGEAAVLISEREEGELIAVRQDFSGAFAGRALLIFPQATSLELIRAVVSEELSVAEASEMEQEALAETGNIILNGCLGTMANMLRQSLTMTLPEVFRGKGAAFFHPDGTPEPDGLVLFLYINFSVLGRDIRGYIAMLLDMPSLAALRLLVQQFIDSVMNDDADAI
jgi:chemotaxis protein CheC